MKCTYRGCMSDGTVVWDDGHVVLCDAHDEEWAQLAEKGTPRQILGFWARAHGTQENFADRMMGRPPAV